MLTKTKIVTHREYRYADSHRVRFLFASFCILCIIAFASWKVLVYVIV